MRALDSCPLLVRILCLLSVFANIAFGSTLPSGTGSALSWNLAPYYEIGENTYASSLADLDLDGNLDLAVINAADTQQPRIHLLYSDVSGKFNQRVTYLLNFDPSAITSGDLNLDGRPDIVVTGGLHNRIAVFLNLEGRTFGPAAVSTPPDPPSGTLGEFQDVRIGDFDADGNADVVALQDQFNRRLRFFHVEQNGMLTVYRTLEHQTGGESWEDEMEIGDFNGDTISDVALGGGGPFGSRNMSFVFGRAGTPLALTFGFSLPHKLNDLHVIDMDGDGDRDLVLGFEDTTFTEHSIQVFTNSGNGTFNLRTRLPLAYSFPPITVVAGDFNGDGISDLAASVMGRGEMVMMTFGRPNGVFGSIAYYSVPFGRSIFKGDFNHDGALDLCTVSELFLVRNNLAVLFNNGTGKLAAPPAVLGSPPFVVAGDMNNDGFKDLVSAGSSNVDILLNDLGNGFILPEVSRTSPAFLNALAVADLNGDGNRDAVTGHAINNRGIASYIGNGNSVLGSPQFMPLAAGINRLTVADFNNDSKDDVIALDETGKAHVLLSNGTGSFTAAPGSPLTLSSSNVRILTGQFTNDAFIDLVIPISSATKLFVGNGSGQFTLTSAQLPTFSSYPVAGDFDEDGNLDVAGHFGSSMIAALGDGNGNFPTIFSKVLNITEVDSLVSADFDLDGDEDVAFITDIDRDYPGNLVIVQSNGEKRAWADPVFYLVGGLLLPLYKTISISLLMTSLLMAKRISGILVVPRERSSTTRRFVQAQHPLISTRHLGLRSTPSISMSYQRRQTVHEAIAVEWRVFGSQRASEQCWR